MKIKTKYQFYMQMYSLAREIVEYLPSFELQKFYLGAALGFEQKAMKMTIAQAEEPATTEHLAIYERYIEKLRLLKAKNEGIHEN